ncbi:hypothetical protein PR048_018595 [Dryococelus australis]|uniref:Uncharacterized protein n=1 Tax=Dryococelus australis TaxID=614101 RepID=A0ABQ9HCP8_9NEOP|nr:hypothetical protein PR048_018595 [Dryococelus australis]
MLAAPAESLKEEIRKWTTYYTTTSNTKISILHRSSMNDIGRSFELNSCIMKPSRLTPPIYSNEIIFNYRISRTRRVVKNTLGAMCLVFRFLRIPILLNQTTLLSLLLRRLFIRLRGHLIENQNYNLFLIHGRITQNLMHCSLSGTH